MDEIAAARSGSAYSSSSNRRELNDRDVDRLARVHGSLLILAELLAGVNAMWERQSRHLEDSIVKSVEASGRLPKSAGGGGSLSAAAGSLRKAVARGAAAAAAGGSGGGGGLKSAIKKSIERYYRRASADFPDGVYAQLPFNWFGSVPLGREAGN